MGSLTDPSQVDLDKALGARDKELGISYKDKAKQREGVELPGVLESESISISTES